MGQSSGFRFLEHVTDALAETWGSTLEEAFEEAGIALFETMLDTTKVRSRITEEIYSTGHDEKELLYNYLEKLLLLFEIRQLALGSFRVEAIRKIEGQVILKGTAGGEPYDREKHGGKVEVKGITYHLMEIERHHGRVTVRFLLDL